MLRGLVPLLALAAVAGCEVGRYQPPVDATPTAATPVAAPSPPEVVELRAEVRARVKLWERNEYVPDDPALLDPSIAWALDTVGRAPERREQVLEQAASGVYNTLTRDPAGIAAVEALLTARYQHPTITREGDLVHIDVGVIPGKPSVFRGGLYVTSSLAVNGSHGLVAAEVVRNLELGMAAHPDATRYQLEIEIPSRWSKPAFAYVYDRSEDRIAVYRDGERSYWVTAELGGRIDGVTSLHWSELEQRTMDRFPARAGSSG